MLQGRQLRRALLALASGGHIRLALRRDDEVAIIALPADCEQRGTFILEVNSGHWGVWQKFNPESLPSSGVQRGFYSLMRALDVSMDAIGKALDV